MVEFSIIIPFYNSISTLGRAISSVTNQSNSNWELILVNDGSNDGSVDSVVNFLKDPRIKLFNQENFGVTISRNKGAKIATGKWLIFLDADDELVENALEKFRYFIDKNEVKFKIVKAGYKKINADFSKDFISHQTGEQSFLSGSFTIKNEFFGRLGGYDIHLKFSENAELNHRIALSQEPVGYLGMVVLIYHESVAGGSKNSQNIIYSLIHILNKHNDTLSFHVKHLYHQIIGVNYLRFSKFGPARIHFAWAILFKPWKPATWGRFGIACIPFLAKKFYSTQISYA